MQDARELLDRVATLLQKDDAANMKVEIIEHVQPHYQCAEVYLNGEREFYLTIFQLPH